MLELVMGVIEAVAWLALPLVVLGAYNWWAMRP
jgi:hypothetical protein